MWLFLILHVRQCQVKCAAATVLLRCKNWWLNFSWRQAWKEWRCVWLGLLFHVSHVTMRVLKLMCPFKIASNLRSLWQLLTWSSTVRSTDAATLWSQASLHHPTLLKRKRPACCFDCLKQKWQMFGFAECLRKLQNMSDFSLSGDWLIVWFIYV